MRQEDSAQLILHQMGLHAAFCLEKDQIRLKSSISPVCSQQENYLFVNSKSAGAGYFIRMRSCCKCISPDRKCYRVNQQI
jgi:hypothetical protein